MANAARGEVSLEVGGKPVTLAATLGALANIEDRLDISISQIGERMQRGRISDMIVIVEALSEGAVTAADLHPLPPSEMNTLASRIGEAFNAMSFGDDDEGDDSGN